jgi:starvation-inducible DNA-binding protein
MMKAHSDAGEDQVNSIVTMLNLVLADECLLYSKTRNCDWTVNGPETGALHELFEQQYDRLADIIDCLTERIRTLGAQAIGTMSEFLQYARLKEPQGARAHAARMIAHLLDDHESLLRTLKGDLAVCAEEFKDMDTGKLLNDLMARHENMARTLRAQLEHS